MALTYFIVLRCILIYLDNNEISVIDYKQLISILVPKLKILNLSNVGMKIDHNNIGSMGAKWLIKINMPLL